jgi:hypothetical protein
MYQATDWLQQNQLLSEKQYVHNINTQETSIRG